MEKKFKPSSLQMKICISQYNERRYVKQKKNSGLMFDPTIRFENCEVKDKLINEKKQKI